MSPRSETAEGNIDSASIPKQYCAQVSANYNEDPIGSAPGHHTYLLVEVPLPWHHQVEQSVHFPNGLNDLLQQAAERGRKFRFLSFASDMLASPRGWRRVISYRKAGSPFARFCKKEYIVPEQAVNGLAESLLEDRSAVSFEEYEVHTDGVRDLFVCTHGSHDVCCGKFGYPMYKEIEQRYTDVEDANVRVWRTSHFGGHRHAPTLLELPDGRYWAQLKPELLDALLLRKGDVRQLSRHYRGWSGLSAFEQVAERAAFMEQGWAWDRY
ncbi:sucrase ferredoxin [Paenibacillus sp. NPDC056579]|uniref:sucrase ferredoxin n=1 Tax=Paenibacillus sp. NPDC056579 TaxID=3345871 RepID=UPI0036CA8CE3